MAKDHWLAGVARILRAETENLRELARIGGVDPRTAYVGTRLDGANLRGQDLRGMMFTDLDLAKVEHDAATRIDPEQVVVAAGPEPELDPARPAIFVASSRVNLASVERALAPLRPLLFGPQDLAALLSFARDRDRPVLLLVFEDDMRTAEGLLSRIAPDWIERAVLIVQGRKPLEWFHRWGRLAGRRPVYFVIDQAIGRGLYRIGLASDTKSLAAFVATGWEKVSHFARSPSVALRARGVAPRPVLDACAQLYDRIWRIKLQAHAKTLIGPFHQTSMSELQAIEALFQRTDLLTAESRDTFAFVSLLDEAYSGSDELYAVDLSRVIATVARGRLEPLKGRRVTLVSGAALASPRPGIPVNHAAIANFAFQGVDEVFVHPRADVGWVLDRLLVFRELWVTARDILGAGALDDLTPWSLIASQLRRIAPQSGGEARQAYLGLIVREAARRSLRDPRGIESLLEGGNEIKIERFQADLGRARFTAHLVPRGGARAQAYASLDIEIDPAGAKVLN